MPPLSSFNKSCLALAIAQILSIQVAESATIEVTSSLDDNGANCTLREAIATVNIGSAQGDCDVDTNTGTENLGTNDTINFATPNTSITLGGTELAINKDVVINGDGTIINGYTVSRVLEIISSVVTLNEMTITGGSVFGGGGIRTLSSTSLTLNNTTVSGNSATFGGGIASYASSRVTLNYSIVSGNSAIGGGIFSTNTSSITLNNSMVSGNLAPNGGGIYSTGSSIVALNNSTVLSGNSATNNGGGIFSTGTSSVTLNNSTVSGNSTTSGGGIFTQSSSSVTLNNSTMSGNSATNGGGGIFSNVSSFATLNNSTVSGNSSPSGGGIFFAGTSSVTLNNSTVSDNSATIGGGGIFSSANSSLTLTNSIVSGNTASSAAELRDSSSETVAADNNNLFGHSGLTNDLAFIAFTPSASDLNATSNGGDIPTAIDSILDTTLADNGGPTLTHALVTGSPAINSADDTLCAAAPINGLDQRGKTRPSGKCDIGSFELDDGGFIVIPLLNNKVVVIPSG